MATVLTEMTIGEWIAGERTKRGWTQAQLQAECYMRDPDNIVRENDISRYESGQREPTLPKLRAIAKAFGTAPPLHLLKGRYLSLLRELTDLYADVGA